MRMQTAEEIKIEMINKMGSDFGILTYSLRNEILWLTYLWTEFETLFASKLSRIDIMNESGSTFFFVVQQTFRDGILMGIARLTDPKVTMGKKNLTLKAIPDYLPDTELRGRIDLKLKDLDLMTRFCRDWRNRKLAHHDYDLYTQSSGVKILEQATKESITTAIKLIQDIYNDITNTYLNSEIHFDLPIGSGSSLAILHRLEDGLRFDEGQRKRKLRGEIDNTDFKSRV